MVALSATVGTGLTHLQLFFLFRLSSFLTATGSHYMALAGLELTEILLPLPPSAGINIFFIQQV